MKQHKYRIIGTNNMNNLDKQYIDLLQDILDNGVKKEDRTGTGTLSVFGRQIRHKMSEGFPILTTKKLHFKSIVVELLWFLKGSTNIKYLLDNNVHIWDGDCYKNYCKYVSSNESKWNKWMRNNNDETLSMYTKEEFINKIKIDNQFAEKWGDLGSIYGSQWRSWNQDLDGGTDQIKNLINDLKTNPDSRRLLVTAWNPSDLSYQILPPCHYGFQVYTRNLSPLEIVEQAKKDNLWKEEIPENSTLTDLQSKFKTKAISLIWNQRSVDTFLGR